MIQGQSLPAAFVDLVTKDEAEQPTDETQVSGYVMLSRAKDPMTVWLLRAFPRELFTRGPPTGPHVLLQKLRGALQLQDVVAEMNRLDEHKSKTTTLLDPTKRLYRCTHCLLSGRTPFMKPAIAFGAHTPTEVTQNITSHGAWTRCLPCQEAAAELRAHAQQSQPTTQATQTPCVDPHGLVCHRCQLRRPKLYYDPSQVKNRNKLRVQLCNACKGSSFCTSCNTWKQDSDFRSGSECCKLCQLVQCAGCGTHKPPSAYSEQDRCNFFHAAVNVLCQACHDDGKHITTAEHKVYRGVHSHITNTCSACGVTQPVKAFRRTKGNRIQICRTCEVMPCAACGVSLPQAHFTSTEVSNHFTRSVPVVCVDCRRKGSTARAPTLKHVCDGPCRRTLGRQQFPPLDWSRKQKEKKERLVCSQCKQVEVAREKELREKLKTSRRRKCTCQQAIGHKQTCPMHVSYAGERPYPGCDVISRADSEWFHQRTQKPRLS